MERQEPKLGKVDPADLEFRPRTYRGPSQPTSSINTAADRLAWKIGLAVGIGVLLALLIFNAYERAQMRRDLEQANRYFAQEMKKAERELAAVSSQVPMSSLQVPQPLTVSIRPVPPGYRCAGGALLTRQNGGWTNITARHNHWYCPETGRQSDCYQVTPRSVGCVR